MRSITGPSNLKAVATVKIHLEGESRFNIYGFKVVLGKNGVFVSLPSRKGKGKDEEGNEIEKWYDDVGFEGEDAAENYKEIKEAILNAYECATPTTQATQEERAEERTQAAAVAHTPTATKRKQLW